jgi:NACalpha-BTF3-like transcription factor
MNAVAIVPLETLLGLGRLPLNREVLARLAHLFRVTKPSVSGSPAVNIVSRELVKLASELGLEARRVNTIRKVLIAKKTYDSSKKHPNRQSAVNRANQAKYEAWLNSFFNLSKGQAALEVAAKEQTLSFVSVAPTVECDMFTDAQMIDEWSLYADPEI